jgi:hypothetical protein
MAEIRSTLDIIMEKAKNLTVTDEDKKEFAEKEIQGRVHGLFQKYRDGILSTRQFKEEMTSFDEDGKAVAKRQLLAACFEAMTVDGENQPFFEILDLILGCDIKPVLDLMDEFQEQQNEERANREAARLDTLRTMGISGSAVIPNLGADPVWREYQKEMQKRFQGKLTPLELCPKS